MRVGASSGRRVESSLVLVSTSDSRRLSRVEQQPHSCQGIPRQKGRLQNWSVWRSLQGRQFEGPASHSLYASSALSILRPSLDCPNYHSNGCLAIYSKSVRDLVQWSLCFLRDPQALSSDLASLSMLQPWAFGSLKTCRDLGLSL